ncbi:MAG: mannose-1-phosphate guanylyltransferase [Candidatus Aureabacteria bacterium]|nr:mannose-1-phosphate guanylyltransferase [Candidatus Auribacterota bacterium]
MDAKIYAVLMAGGKGERFWPRSRESAPKQFLAVYGQKTLAQLSVSRIKKLVRPRNIFVITGARQLASARKQLKDIPAGNIIAEPVGRNTAPCAALAAAVISRKMKDAVILMLPADSYISDEALYLKTLKEAAEFAFRERKLVTVGITPRYPSTEYGYIEPAKRACNKSKIRVFPVRKFKEKPSLSVAKRYLKRGLKWNSGMFIWRADVFIDEFSRHAPQYRKSMFLFLKAGNSIRKVMNREYPGMVKDSIDYALMEKSENIAMVEGNFGWDDLGTWVSLKRFMKKDSSGNYISGDVFMSNCRNCMAISDKGALGMADMHDVVAVKTADAVMVCPADNVPEVKKIVGLIQQKGKIKYL